jgi:hypothetical protein
MGLGFARLVWAKLRKFSARTPIQVGRPIERTRGRTEPMQRSAPSAVSAFRLSRAFYAVGLVGVIACGGVYLHLRAALGDAHALELKIANKVGRMRVLDQMLGDSALLAASTRDTAYERAYRDHASELDDLLRDTLALLLDAPAEALDRDTDAASRRAIEIEQHSFALDHGGRHDEALASLRGADYLRDKAISAKGMARTLDRLEQLARERRRALELQSTLLHAADLLFLVMLIGPQWLSVRTGSQPASHDGINPSLNPKPGPTAGKSAWLQRRAGADWRVARDPTQTSAPPRDPNHKL